MIANVPVRVTMMMATDMTAVPTVMAMHSVAAAVAATMAAVKSAAAAAVLGAGRSRSKHSKAERSARGDGQKGRFTNHDTLL